MKEHSSSATETISNHPSPPLRQLPRSCGVLLHVTSLPGRFGIGDMGPAAVQFLERLAAAKQTWWQTLPLGPGNCPYQCSSAMAGNANLISPDQLFEAGLLSREEIAVDENVSSTVDFAKVSDSKRLLLARAFERFQASANTDGRERLEQFTQSESQWLDDFCLFTCLKHAYPDRPWASWPRKLARRNAPALRTARKSFANEIALCQFTQFIFFQQLAALRERANRLGIKLIGDLPIFVSGESSDVWAHPHLFHLDKDRRPKVVAGVPPDYFSETGQRWGNPLYDWRQMQRDGFRWWIARAKMALRQADLVRIDHFRGFAASWTIPASEPTAKKGRWVKAPGEKLFDVLQTELGGLPFIAEDLGLITPDVEALRERFALPGMRVLQFAFGGDATNPHLPHNFVRNCIAYTGTHDNDATAGWYRTLDRKTRGHLRRYTHDAGRNPADALMRLAWSSVADVAIAPLQDVLGLGSESRMNTPGTNAGNWTWRASEEMLKAEKFAKLRKWTEAYGRSR